MKRASLIAVMVLSVCAARAADGWITDFEAAKAAAAKDGRDILMEVTGSDWCPWCIKLRKEVLGEEAFAKGAAKDFVLLAIDLPQKTKLDEKLQKQNDKIVDDYGVKYYPTVFLLDPTGRPYTRTGYHPGGVEKYLERLQRLKKSKAVRDEGLAKADKASGAEQAKLYDAVLGRLLDEELLINYDDLVEKTIAADKDNGEGLQFKYRYFEVANAINVKKYDIGLKKMEALLKEFPVPPELKQQLFQMKGVALERKEDVKGAVEALETALAAAPEAEAAAEIKESLAALKKKAETPAKK